MNKKKMNKYTESNITHLKRDKYVIILQIYNSKKNILQWEMRIDEALEIIMGLSKVLTYISIDHGTKGKFLQQFCKYFDLNKYE
jgi:hypothetical protein